MQLVHKEHGATSGKFLVIESQFDINGWFNFVFRKCHE